MFAQLFGYSGSCCHSFSTQDKRSYTYAIGKTFFKPTITPCLFQNLFFQVIHNHVSLLCCFKKLSSSLAFYVLIINETLYLHRSQAPDLLDLTCRNMILSIKKVIVFLKIITCLLLSTSSLIKLKHQLSPGLLSDQANLGFGAVRSLNYVIQRIRLKYKKHVNLALGFCTELH